MGLYTASPHTKLELIAQTTARPGCRFERVKRMRRVVDWGQAFVRFVGLASTDESAVYGIGRTEAVFANRPSCVMGSSSGNAFAGVGGRSV